MTRSRSLCLSVSMAALLVLGVDVVTRPAAAQQPAKADQALTIEQVIVTARRKADLADAILAGPETPPAEHPGGVREDVPEWRASKDKDANRWVISGE